MCAEQKLSQLIESDGLSSPAVQKQPPSSAGDRGPDTKTSVS